MASCKKQAIESILTATRAIPYDWSTVTGATKSQPNLLFQKVLAWNNQVKRDDNGKGYAFEFPACFLESVPEYSTQLLDNVTLTDYQWKLHIIDFRLNELNEIDLDQNLEVIDYDDLCRKYLVGFTPTNCSTLFCLDEGYDTNHTAVYHFILTLKSCLKDTKGSPLDPDQNKVIYIDPPTNAELNTQFNEETPPLTLEIIPT